MVFISVIIPSYNRKKELDQVLDSYYLQKSVGEVIIIDDCSKEDYLSIIKKYRKKYKHIRTIYYRNKTNMGAGASRNIGIKLATGKWILWGEDDAFLALDYTKILLETVNNKTVAFGSIYYGITPEISEKEKKRIIMQQQKENKKLFNYDTFESYYRVKSKKKQVPFGHALILLERAAYDDVSYYEGYKVNGLREETDAQIQLLKKGYRIVYDSNTCCYHFPTRKRGGQHTANKIKYDFYMIKNNNIFWDRHYDFLKKKYNLKRSKISYKLCLLYYIWEGDLRGIKRRFSK